MDFNLPYDRDNYIRFFRSQFLPEDFEQSSERIPLTFSPQYTQQVTKIGQSKSLDLNVYEVEHTSENDPRVSLSKESFRLLAEYGQKRALVLFVSKPSDNYRLSLVTIDLMWEEGKRPTREYSNPRRFSFFLGPDAKVHTPQEYLIKPGRVADFDDLKKRFSIEVVNKDFYIEIAKLFTRLSGGKRKIGSRTKDYGKGLLKFPVADNTKKKEFVVRLIGRLVFCWFLKKKESDNNIALLPEEVLSAKAIENYRGLGGYYHSILEPLFFEILNTPMDDRAKEYQSEPWSQIPFLNGGLFTPHEDDYYRDKERVKAQSLNTLKVPDEWLKELFEIFETYNFTIDENTSVDVELSIEPEMLGRIFENLLAEINPETGESARKATGSYYTPRPIVEYMVDQSIKQYLLTQANVSEEKIDSLLDYSKDASDGKLTDRQANAVVEALDKLRVLDPACGSGAFPMGILQKILLILQKIDPDSKKWKTNLLKKIPNVAARKALAERLETETWQYIHKLGFIQNSIYGVDIQPIAAEISKLRIFLSLIVDETVNDDKDNRGVEPLPNLKFKFVCGNSLIDKFFGRTIEIDTVQTKSKTIVERLASLKADFFSAIDEKEKVELNLKILQGKIELAEQLLADLVDTNQFIDNLFGSEAQSKKQQKEKEESMTKKLQAELLNKAIENARVDIDNLIAKPQIELAEVEQIEARHFNESFIWKLDFAEIFAENNGFDIIIANPPYLGEKGHKKMFREIKKGNLGRFYQGKMDLFYFFFHLALNLGKHNSNIAFISTNYYITAFGAKRLRQDFLQRTIIRELINFNELRIFESALGQHNMITVLEKAQDRNTIAQTCITQRQGVASSEVLQQMLNGKDADTDYYEVSQKDLYDGDECYIRLTGKESDHNKNPLQRILTRIKNQGQSLGVICNVNNGVFAGADRLTKAKKDKYRINDAQVGEGIFVLTNDEVKDLGLSKEEMKMIKPLFKNSDIKKYYTNTKEELNLINLRYTDRPNLSDYPNIKKHLTRFKRLLADRPRTGTLESAFNKGYWYVMSTSRRLDFDAAKIVFPQRSNTNTFGYNDISWYAMSDVFFITSKDEREDLDLKYILALLNAELYFVWLYFRGKRKGEVLELTGNPVAEIPIKEVNATEQDTFIEIVDKILPLTQSEDYLQNPQKQAKVKRLEKQIDQMVYKLYGLTDEEIAIVEKNARR